MSQLNKTSFENLYGSSGTTFPDNTTSQISEGDMRQFGDDVADSFLNITDNFIDEDSFASDSATKVPSQQSVKAYVGTQTARGSETFSYYFTDFETTSDPRFSTGTFNDGGGVGATNTASTFGVATAENTYGVWEINTSTSTAGGAYIARNGSLTFGFGFSFQQEFRLALSALSDATDTYTAFCGFNDATGGDGVDGAYFRYTHGTNGGRWQAVTRSNSVETSADTGIAADAGIFHIFKIIANSTGTQVDFYIDGVLKNSITTNIISDAARLTVTTYVIKKTAGSTSRSVYIDLGSYLTTRTTAR